MRLRVGQTLISAADTTTVIVIKAGAGGVLVTCGGVAMVSEPTTAGSKVAPLRGHANGTQLGKRYETADGSVELLCTKAGTGSLAVGDVPMTIAAAKALPASD